MRKKVLNMDYSESFIPAMMDMLARQQGEIFLYEQQHGYSLDDFIPKYMHSDFCNREMDAEFSFFHFKMAESCFPYIQQELRLKQGADTIGDAYWVGMMYRYLVLATGRPSREIVENISYKLNGTEPRSIVVIKKISQTPPKYPRASAQISKKPLS